MNGHGRDMNGHGRDMNNEVTELSREVRTAVQLWEDIKKLLGDGRDAAYIKGYKRGFVRGAGYTWDCDCLLCARHLCSTCPLSICTKEGSPFATFVDETKSIEERQAACDRIIDVLRREI